MADPALDITLDRESYNILQWSEGKDFDGYARENLIVRDHETSMLVPFEFRKGQQILHNIVEKRKAEGKRVRILNLKARRYGGSTYVEGRFYFYTSQQDNKNTFIVAHEEESTRTLYRMAQLFHEQDPYKPSTIHNSSNEMRFDTSQGTGLKSEYRLATARNVHAGKSQGIHYLHISEEAMWEGDPQELLTSLFACIPKSDDSTEIFRESTAQGFGNTFQEDVFNVYGEGRYPYYEEDGITYAWYNPDSEWIVVFIPWFVVETYTKPFDNQQQLEEFKLKVSEKEFDKNSMRWMESEAERIRKRYHLSYAQLHWRDDCIKNEQRGSISLFHQNYPATVDEAFLKTGSNVFSKEMCDHLESLCQSPILIGEVRRYMGKSRITPNLHGAFQVWEKVKQDCSYFIVIDSAGGKKKLSGSGKKLTSQEPDRTNIDVFNHKTGMQVAQWNGHIPYDSIGDLVIMIGEMYGIKTRYGIDLPIACVELQNDGYTVVTDLSREQYPQYEWKDGEPGWSSNRKTKPEACDNLTRSVRDGEIKINCIGTVNEMRTFVEENMEFSAAPGCKDDRVDTAAIASILMLTLPRKYAELRSKKRGGGEVKFKNWEFKNKITPVKQSGYEEYYV